MATSSIFADFSIHDPKTLKNFIDALEIPEQKLKEKNHRPIRQVLFVS